VVRFVDQLISGAVAEHASDIHIEPFEDNLRVRYRLDGRLQEVEALPATDRLAVTSRIKIMAGLNIAERRQPQDGASAPRSMAHPGIRVATVPTPAWRKPGAAPAASRPHGAGTAQARFRRHWSGAPAAGARPAPWPAAGHRPDRQRQDHDLYAALSQLNHIDRKILTVEDPIEYQLPGVNQTQVNPKFGLTFAHVLPPSCAMTRTSSWSARSAMPRRGDRRSCGADRPSRPGDAAYQ